VPIHDSSHPSSKRYVSALYERCTKTTNEANFQDVIPDYPLVSLPANAETPTKAGAPK
jgi:hypothetical protein